jgi:hypothetical protein
MMVNDGKYDGYSRPMKGKQWGIPFARGSASLFSSQAVASEGLVIKSLIVQDAYNGCGATRAEAGAGPSEETNSVWMESLLRI